MNIRDWIIQKFSTDKTVTIADIMCDDSIKDAITEATTREIAFWTCVNIVSNVLEKCEIKTYWAGTEIKGEEYYTWNVEPNRNQNAAQFWKKITGQLYRYNCALVIERNGELYVADSFVRESAAFRKDLFTGICIDGIDINRDYWQDEVLYMELNSENMRPLVAGIYASYSKVMDTAGKLYKRSLANKGILNISAQAQNDKNFSKTLTNLMSNYFKPFFEKDHAVLPLFDGYNYDNQNEKTAATQPTSRDIKALTDDIYDFTARAFCIPSTLVKGDVENKSNAIRELLTMCIDPLAAMIEKEINRKRYGKNDYTKGNYVKIDTSKALHVELTDTAAAVEKLISSGVYTINDIRKAFGLSEIDEDWANRHYMTKNFATMEEIVNPKEGGEKSAENENLLQNRTGTGAE